MWVVEGRGEELMITEGRIYFFFGVGSSGLKRVEYNVFWETHLFPGLADLNQPDLKQ